MKFVEKLDQATNHHNSLVCVGLDPDPSKLPKQFERAQQPLFEFNKAIIEATKDLVCAFKPNSAFYEATGALGIEQLKATCDYIHKVAPEVPILLDFKRGDIGNTNAKYAEFAFDYLKVDAVTLQPYQGGEALAPFFEYKEKGIFILAKTSNSGSDEFQNLEIDGRPFYELVVKRAMSHWNENGNIMFVAGATYPNELKRIRELVGDATPLLVPGIGAQGGELAPMLKAGLNSHQSGLIINSSREIIFASSGTDFAETARSKAEELRNTINQVRENYGNRS